MQQAADQVREFCISSLNSTLTQFDVLPPSGSDRRYFRAHTAHSSYIACFNENIRENQAFIYFTRHFREYGAPLPEVLHVNEAGNIYILDDLGTVSLLDILERDGFTPQVYALFQQSLKELANMQVRGGADLDYNQCLTAKEFGKQAILTDLLYFKYYFLDTLKIPYDKQQLIEDFEALSTYLSHTEFKFFMFRDFQSRNILVQNGKVFFIDYQGGMRGALQYDAASLLWQAKADLSDDWKNRLLDDYIGYINEVLPHPVDKTVFISQYNGYVIIRLLQVLGAYGFRGLFERKAHFLTSIPLALRNLRWFLENKRVGIVVPEMDRLLGIMVTDEIISRFEHTRATPETPLVVNIKSFSYKKGLPADESENGGGYIFDCRGILNPGRFDEYKQLTGRDKEVKDFLEQRTKMPDFLNNIYNILDISVEDYIKRGFEQLMICFGCTGGQHRSVYAADAVARHLRNKFGVKIQLEHREQKIYETKS
ncbi:MAG: phosphotransferase [Dinghuibacter sp.]|nr:phosphotransferase [Dinghuibacter sp.]